MGWNEHRSHRCQYCNEPVGRNIMVKFQGREVPNRRKTCLSCKQKGCLACMEGNVEHGILHHKNCPRPSDLAKRQDISRPTAIRLGDVDLEPLSFRVVVAQDGVDSSRSDATIKIRAGERIVHAASEGNGPVDALNRALRKALSQILEDSSPLERIRLIDYSVSVVDGRKGTAAEVKVIITFRDGRHVWRTTAQNPNIIEASYQALLEGIAQGLGRVYEKGHSQPEPTTAWS